MLKKLKEFGNLFKPYGIARIAAIRIRHTRMPRTLSHLCRKRAGKARHAAGHSGLPALADDSGICAAALNGAPGIHSARYA